MNTRTYRSIIYILLLGVAIFIMPLFILKALTFLLLAGLLIRFIIYRKISRFINTIKNMNNGSSYKRHTSYGNKESNYKTQTIEIEAKTIYEN